MATTLAISGVSRRSIAVLVGYGVRVYYRVDVVCIPLFRDDPKSTQCLVVSNNAKKGCEIIIEGDSLFNVLR